MKLNFYIPRGMEENEDVKKIKETLENVKSSYSVITSRQIINKEEEEELKSKILWQLSVVKRIGIKQTKRTKSLYPQLIVTKGEKPITFYPQSYSGNEITIQDFLEGILKGEVKCFHEKYEIEEELKGN